MFRSLATDAVDLNHSHNDQNKFLKDVKKNVKRFKGGMEIRTKHTLHIMLHIHINIAVINDNCLLS